MADPVSRGFDSLQREDFHVHSRTEADVIRCPRICQSRSSQNRLVFDSHLGMLQRIRLMMYLTAKEAAAIIAA